jgi:prepilin-type N-terminal cleavage/methylation domain-containing protein
MRNKGFTLLELSIVLVMIGIIVGGILAGREIIRAAELNSIATHMTKYQTAYNQYKDKYKAVPGDHRNAYEYFGSDCASSAGDCNGDGNRRLAGGTHYKESYMFFRHLYLAGFVEDELNGNAAANSSQLKIGENLPMFDIPGLTAWPAPWQKFDYYTYGQGNVALDLGVTANILSYGRIGNSSWPYLEAFKPEDAKAIDSKIDDGEPGTGAVIAGDSNTSGFSGCTNSALIGLTTNREYMEAMKSGSYRVGDSDIECKLGLILEEPV